MLSMTYGIDNHIPIVIEENAYEGVKRIGEKIAGDFQRVTGTRPEILNTPQGKKEVFIFATWGQSPILEQLAADGKFQPDTIQDRNEVYQIQWIPEPFPGTEKALLIAGSDKRGTIYGMFALSEHIGVSPLHYWGDATPLPQASLTFSQDLETVSKEPSVKYRGFFINDEWPCFGNWTMGRFGGFTAEMYDHVFEFLLRMKGNYLWPAMWTSSFPLDGPGSLNEELADIYGVVIGYSHHEPCLRASEEWDIYRGPDSKYGEFWNYFVNKDGLNAYWEDGLKRSGQYENIAMLGMRGERDSELLGRDSTVKENVDLLKDVITNQRRLLDAHAPGTPQMLALYKEVEEYFYGSPDYEGLKNWDGLDGVIHMLCDDNFGFVRTLPTPDIADRKFGMYYHFDYHGGPISYEWMPSTAYERTWEQLSKAYEHGVNEVWIVNVGDLKFNEVPLNYFMDLAYDFDKWGTSNPDSVKEYMASWMEKTFPSLSLKLHTALTDALQGYIKLNAKRRPEALNAAIYHAAHHLEADRVLEETYRLNNLLAEIKKELPSHFEEAFYSMIWLPATASLNLLQMHLYGAKNHHFARQGKVVANQFAALVTETIEYDRQLFEEFSNFKDGKWKGHELEDHIGFTVWNEDGNRYPLRMTVEPTHKPRMVVSRKDEESIYFRQYGRPMTVLVDDFLSGGIEEVILEVANDGTGSFEFVVEGIPAWLSVSQAAGRVSLQEDIVIKVNRELLSEAPQSATLYIKDEDTTVAVEVHARQVSVKGLPAMTFLPRRGVVAMDACHYFQAAAVSEGAFVSLPHYGRSENGMKVFPPTAAFKPGSEAPSLTYSFLVEEAGSHVVEVWSTPANPVANRQPLSFTLNGDVQTAAPADFLPYHTDARWCQGVLDNIRKTSAVVDFEAGVQTITLGALEPGLVLERIFIYKPEHTPAPSYLGPQESYRT